MKDKVFALDIGTRSVIGIVGEQTSNQLKVEAVEVIEHRNRAMIDGQIHHINQVADVVNSIKYSLEEKTGLTLTKVAVAAAGRALKTSTGERTIELNQIAPISTEQVLNLEIEAVQKAQQELGKELNHNRGKVEGYHCVGYSVKKYTLEGHDIGSLVSQQGNSMGVEVVATFLPRLVVESLFTVLKTCDLEMSSLTLEPIAASKLVIPVNMRQLNIALIDIGAGTSDIAITREGMIISYAMVPMAGDEITESICNKLLVDFDVGETIKRKLNKNKQITYTDILGQKVKVKPQQVIKDIDDVLKEIAEKIANEILALNGKSPQAVFCVGGGSMIPVLPSLIAHKLGLPAERVVVKGTEIINQIEGVKGIFVGPEAMTPLGILISANDHAGLMNVEINGKLVGFYNSGKAKVVDALLAAGISPNSIHGKPGNSLAVNVNGKLRFLKGTMGTPGKIYVNGKEASLKTEVTDYCKIDIAPGTDGENSTARLKDIIEDIKTRPVNIYFNDLPMELKPVVTVDGESISDINYKISDGNEIEVKTFETVAEVLKLMDYNLKDFENKSISYSLNGHINICDYRAKKILINNEAVDIDTKVNEGDRITVAENPTSRKLKISDVINADELQTSFNIFVNGEKITLVNDVEVLKNNKNAALDELINNNDKIEIKKKFLKNFIVADVLSFLDYKKPPEKSYKKLVMTLNGMDAEFTTPIKENDNLDLKWK